jgi:hypothetical protein
MPELHITLVFKTVPRRGADRTPHCFALIKHRELNDHPIEVVVYSSTSPRCSVIANSLFYKSDYAMSAGLARCVASTAAYLLREIWEVLKTEVLKGYEQALAADHTVT